MKIPKTYYQQFKTKKYSTAGFFGFLKRYFINNFIFHINNLIININPQNITELGCGEGFVLGWIKSQHPHIQITGIDINNNDLQLLQQHFSNIKTIKLNLEDKDNLNILNNTDTVLCLETLEHLNNPEEFLQKLTKINYNNLIVSVPWEPFFQLSNFLRGQNIKNFGNDPEHLQKWNHKQMTKLLTKYFTIKKKNIIFPWQIFWIKK